MIFIVDAGANDSFALMAATATGPDASSRVTRALMSGCVRANAWTVASTGLAVARAGMATVSAASARMATP